MNSQQQAATDLREAAALLESEGWIRGRMSAPEGYCAAGAIAVATAGFAASEMMWPTDRTYRASGALTDHLDIKHIPTWNDSPDRTREDVVKAMLGAADAVEVQ